MATENYLQCERKSTFFAMTMVAGFFGAYTYLLRGGVFCNAQTGNIVLLGMALGSMNWSRALYLLIPISAYIGGAIVSEYLDLRLTQFGRLRWDTVLVGFECLVVAVLGLLPEETPDQVCQVALNFICSMQFNTFRQAEGLPGTTTFCTNHIRLIGVHLVKDIRDGDRSSRARWKFHLTMILTFLAGCVISTAACHFFKYRTILGAAAVLAIVFARLCYADLTTERSRHSDLPRGH